MPTRRSSLGSWEVDTLTDAVPGLAQLCVQRLAQNLIKYGPKKVCLQRLSNLPGWALEALLEILVSRNALNDNILPHALTRQLQKLNLKGTSHLRRFVLNSIGRSCPNLRVLDVRGCQQVDNRIVRDVLQHCEHLTSLRLDGCKNISDTAFAPALWKPPLAGLLGLRELSIGNCRQVMEEGLMGYVMKGAPFLNSLGLASCRLTDEVASELLFSFGLECLDLSFCERITDLPFQARPTSTLRELNVEETEISDAAFESIAQCAKQLQVLNANRVMKLTDRGVKALAEGCESLKTLCICHSQVTDLAFESLARCRQLERLDASWCLRASWRVLEILSVPCMAEAGALVAPPLRELRLDYVGYIFANTVLSGCWRALGRGPPSVTTSPGLPPYLGRHVSDPQPFVLPPAALTLSPLIRAVSVPDEQLLTELLPPSADPLLGELASEASTIASTIGPDGAPCNPLKTVTMAFGSTLKQLLLEGVPDVVDSTALEAIAENCLGLEQLALTFPALGCEGIGRSQNSDVALAESLRAVGAACVHLTVLRFDSSLRPHCALIAPLVPPSFGKLRSLALTCAGRSGGLQDGELERILTERKGLEVLELRNCEGLSDTLFPRWCNRERRDAAELHRQLDDDILRLGFGGPSTLATVGQPEAGVPRPSRRRHVLRGAPAAALRSVISFTLGGAAALSDRSGDALAELLHVVQCADVHGCPLLTEESFRSFRKGCRFLSSVRIVTRDRTFAWTAAASAVKKTHSRRSSFHVSGSSGTESN